MQIAKQAGNERGQKLFQMFRQEENEVYIASLARWCTQLKGLELEKRCQERMQEVKLSSEDKKFWLALWKTRSDYRVERPNSTMKRSSRRCRSGQRRSRKKPWYSYAQFVTMLQ